MHGRMHRVNASFCLETIPRGRHEGKGGATGEHVEKNRHAGFHCAKFIAKRISSSRFHASREKGICSMLSRNFRNGIAKHRWGVRRNAGSRFAIFAIDSWSEWVPQFRRILSEYSVLKQVRKRAVRLYYNGDNGKSISPSFLAVANKLKAEEKRGNVMRVRSEDRGIPSRDYSMEIVRMRLSKRRVATRRDTTAELSRFKKRSAATAARIHWNLFHFCWRCYGRGQFATQKAPLGSWNVSEDVVARN